MMGMKKSTAHIGVCVHFPSKYSIVDQASIVKVPNDIPAEIAALFGCAMITGGGALLNDGRPKSGDTVMVVGLGGGRPAGILMALTMDDVTVIAVDGLWRSAQTCVGARGASSLRPQEVLPDSGTKADVVLEATGNAKGFETAFKALAVGGTLVTVSLPAIGYGRNISTCLTSQAFTLRVAIWDRLFPAKSSRNLCNSIR